MKFANLKYAQILAVILTVVSLLERTNLTEVKTKGKSKRSESMMELFNSFFSDSSDSTSMYQNVENNQNHHKAFRQQSNIIFITLP